MLYSRMTNYDNTSTSPGQENNGLLAGRGRSLGACQSNPPAFAILSRDGLAIMLRVVSDPGRISPNEKQGGTWDAFFWVRDAQTLHAELRANGADIVYGPIVQEMYQMEEFAVRAHYLERRAVMA